MCAWKFPPRYPWIASHRAVQYETGCEQEEQLASSGSTSSPARWRLAPRYAFGANHASSRDQPAWRWRPGLCAGSEHPGPLPFDPPVPRGDASRPLEDRDGGGTAFGRGRRSARADLRFPHDRQRSGSRRRRGPARELIARRPETWRTIIKHSEAHRAIAANMNQLHR